jgi:error-prone DNA polymerase
VIHGRVQRDVEIVHVVADRLEDRSEVLIRLAPDGLGGAMTPPMAHADEVNRPIGQAMAAPTRQHPRDVRVIPKSRDFH